MLCQNCHLKLPFGKIRCPSCSCLSPYNIKGHEQAKDVQILLKQMIDEQADNIANNAQFVALMFDYLPGYETECVLLKKAVDMNFLSDIIDAEKENRKLVFVNMRSRLIHEAGFSRDDAEFVLSCFGYMLNMPYLSSLMIDDSPSEPVVEPKQDDIPVQIKVKPKVFGKFDAFIYRLSSKIVIKDNFTEIAGYCFDNYGAMKEISLSDSLMVIGEYAFSDCKRLESIDIPDSVKKIGKGAFNACTGLKRIKLPADILSIGDNCFFCCMSLQTLRVPDSVSSIGENAFSGCGDLEKLVLSKNVKFIDTNAFAYCGKLTVVCSENSFVHRYCMQNKIKYETVPMGESLPSV